MVNSNLAHSKTYVYRSESGGYLHSTGDLGPLGYKSGGVADGKQQGGVADGKQQGGVAGGREDPEGSIATDEYLKMTSAPPPVDVRSRSGSSASCKARQCNYVSIIIISI